MKNYNLIINYLKVFDKKNPKKKYLANRKKDTLD